MILVFFAEGFEEVEAVTCVDILRRAKLDVLAVGVGSKSVSSCHNVVVECDVTEDNIPQGNIEMVVLPGGMPGMRNLENSKVVQHYIDYAVKNDIWLAAICASPRIFGHLGLLDGKKATCYPGCEKELGAAEYTAANAERDGKIITGKCAAASADFAFALVENLVSAEKANELRAKF